MAEWAVEYQGYLSKRRRRVNGWHPRFIVLEHSVLSSFTDETRRRQTGCIRIGAGTLVQVLPQSSGALPGRGVLANAFAVFDPTDDYMLRRRREENGDDDDAASSGALLYSMIFDTSLDEPFSGATPEDSQPPLPLNSTSGDHAGSEQAPFLLAADDSHTLEMWMIALIQCINGAYRPDEGFEAGSDTQPTCWSRGRIDDDANGGWAPMAGPVLCGEGSYIANPSMYLRTRYVRAVRPRLFVDYGTTLDDNVIVVPMNDYDTNPNPNPNPAGGPICTTGSCVYTSLPPTAPAAVFSRGASTCLRPCSSRGLPCMLFSRGLRSCPAPTRARQLAPLRPTAAAAMETLISAPLSPARVATLPWSPLWIESSGKGVGCGNGYLSTGAPGRFLCRSLSVASTAA